MDKAEARRMLSEALAPFRRMSYSELAKRVLTEGTDNCVVFQVTGESGVRYNL
jgi:hypothetical protein